MRIISSLFFLASVGTGWWLWNNHPPTRNFIESHLSSGEFQTLEVLYSPEQIMEDHRKELLRGANYTFLEPTLLFHPYVMMEVKYTKDELSTRESTLLWSLEDGEMVVDTASWEQTHGFEDCLNAHADRNEFKVLNALAKERTGMTREALAKALYIQSEVLDNWLESCKKKKLVVQIGNQYRLHLENPKLQLYPETKMHGSLVTKSYEGAIRAPKKYSVGEIERAAQAAFGPDFAIRTSSEILMPVIQIEVKNPDGSIMTSYWNALTGKRIKK